jgi:hypothetical protein
VAVGSAGVAWAHLGVTGAPLVVAAGAAAAAVAVAVAGLRSTAPETTAPRAALVGGLLLATSAAGFVGAPLRVHAAKPLWDAVARVRAPGEELGVALNYNGDWGLFPWYAREPVRYFNYPAAPPMMIDPALDRPDLFLPRERLKEWFAAKERRFLMTRPRYLREKEAPSWLGSLPRFVVAEGGEYVVLTNLPLPAERP